MAKNAKKSQVSPSSRASASATIPKRASDDQMALRTKSSEGMKRSARLSKVSVERRPKSAIKTKTKHKKKNDKYDTNKPKKPPTAFFYFLEDFRKDFQEQNPNVKSMRDIGKACGEKWKTMTYEEKVQYYDIATGKRAEFDKAMADYIKKKESGEDIESEDSDSELDE
ncbi:hypothetical protein I3760_10G092300 [Carya illinoinensis]|nr:hypothetical protein I3760_10G092300 [Carya illinoinensis]